MTEMSSFVVNPGCGRINGLGAWDVFLARSHAFKMQGFRSQHAAGRSQVHRSRIENETLA